MEPKVLERGSDHIKVSWKPPLEKNGNLTGYLIQYKKGEIIKDEIRLVVLFIFFLFNEISYQNKIDQIDPIIINK